MTAINTIIKHCFCTISWYTCGKKNRDRKREREWGLSKSTRFGFIQNHFMALVLDMYSFRQSVCRTPYCSSVIVMAFGGFCFFCMCVERFFPCWAAEWLSFYSNSIIAVLCNRKKTLLFDAAINNLIDKQFTLPNFIFSYFISFKCAFSIVRCTN